MILKAGTNAISDAYPALKPWLDEHRGASLTLFNDYNECQAKGIMKRA